MLSLGEKLIRPLSAKLTPASSTRSLEKSAYQQDIYSAPGPGATEIVEVLRRRLAVLSGGEDKRGGSVVSIFAPHDDFNPLDLKQTLHYLKDLIGEEERTTGISVLLEGSSVLSRCLDEVISAVQTVFGDCLHAIYIYQSHGLWKSRSSADLKKSLQESSGAALCYVTQQKLFKLISPFQLTNEFGGTLEYNHSSWLERQLAIEKFLRDARIIRKHSEGTIQTCEARLESEGPNPASLEDVHKSCISMGSVIHTTFVNGQKLLLCLQSETTGCLSQCGKGALKQNALQLRQVKQVLDSVTSIKNNFDGRWHQLYGALRKISNFQRFINESAEVITWVESEGERLLCQNGTGVGFGIEEALVKRKHMHRVAMLSMECYARYSQLKSLAQHLLTESSQENAVVQSTVHRLDASCQVFATKVDARRRVAELAVVFHQSYEQLIKLSKDVERRVCAGNSSSASSAHDPTGSTGDSQHSCDSSNSDGCSLSGVDEDELHVHDGHHMTETNKTVYELEETANVLNSNYEDFKRISVAFKKSLQNRDFESSKAPVDKMINAVQKEVEGLRSLIDSKRNHLVQTIQLLSCEQDAKQSITWIDDLCAAAQNSIESDSGIDDESFRARHEKMDSTAKEAYDYGRRLLDTAVRLRKNCKYKTSPSTRIADSLFNSWLRYINTSKGNKSSSSQSSSTCSPAASPLTSKTPLGKTPSSMGGMRSQRRSTIFSYPRAPQGSLLRSFHSCSSLV